MDKIDFDSISRTLDTPKPGKPSSGAQTPTGFGRHLLQSINQVNRRQQSADQAIESLVTGKSQDIHQTMIAMEKADLSFRLLMQVRNKLISAYQEIMRMQI